MATVTWHCRQCQYTSLDEGICPQHRRALVARLPPEQTETLPVSVEETSPGVGDSATVVLPASTGHPDEVPSAGSQRLALKMPWGQQINLPDAGALVIGRSSQAFRDHPRAKDSTQVSREHARFFRDESGELMVVDLHSLNGTYIDGTAVAEEGTVVGSGQTLRLGQDVSCEVVALDEFGEPCE